MKIKSANLSDIALDWAVAKSEGLEIESIHPKYHVNVWKTCPLTGDQEAAYAFRPSANWTQGGPIIEREITRMEDYGDQWFVEGVDGFNGVGSTILIAAMRCCVASKLGDEVEIPDELCQ